MQLNFTFPLHTVNASYKKVATPPISTSTPTPFSGLSPLSTKIFGTPTQMTQFLEGPTPPFLLIKAREGVVFKLCLQEVSFEIF